MTERGIVDAAGWTSLDSLGAVLRVAGDVLQVRTDLGIEEGALGFGQALASEEIASRGIPTRTG